MDEEARKKLEALKEKNKKHVKEKFVLEHVLFQECLSAIKEYTTIDEDRMAEIWNWMTSTLPFSYAGHILWNDVTYKNTSLDHENNCDYLEPDKSCFIVWSDPRLPGVSCKLKSILDNLDDVTAVGFYAWIIPEDSSYIIEAASSNELHVAMLNEEKTFRHKTLDL